MDDSEYVSPCTGVCTLDGDICVGCGRTRGEIAQWQSLSDEEKEEIITDIPTREYPQS